MSDVRQKAKDLWKLAVDEGTTPGERDKQALSGDIVDTIAVHVERYASGLERVMAAGKRISEARGPVTKKRKRTYR